MTASFSEPRPPAQTAARQGSPSAGSAPEPSADDPALPAQTAPGNYARRESDRRSMSMERLRAPGASATNAMQIRRRAHSNHQHLAPVLGAVMLLAAWVMWVVRAAAGESVTQLWPALLIVAASAYLALSWAGRRSYPTGVASPWIKAIHGASLIGAGLFGFGAAATVFGASASDTRLLALVAFALCAAALPALAALATVFRVFAALAMLPLLAAVLSHWPADLALSLVLVVSAVTLFIGHAVLARTLGKAFRADVEQRSLLQHLQQANEALSADRTVLEAESRTDPLTGLANRRYLERALRAEWNRCRRAEAPLSCVMLDIDHFKAYNDRHGHDGGDRCLKAVADTLNNSIRRAGDVVARYGGEEFVLLLPETGSAGAATVADLLKHAVAGEAIEHLDSPICGILTLSLGVATLLPDSDRMPDELLKAADLALYEAKRTGRNRIVRADEQTLESARLTARGLIG